jgi:hypothetical protein
VRAIAALLMTFLVCSSVQAQQKVGSICVAPNSSERPTRFSPGGDYNPATLLLKIDQKEAIPWPHQKPLSIKELTLEDPHLIVLTSDGKRIQSFRFRFSVYPTPELCMSFDGYQGVQLYDKGTNRRRAKYCDCTCP